MRELKITKDFMGDIIATVNEITVAKTCGNLLTLSKVGIAKVGIFAIDGFHINNFNHLEKNIEGFSIDEIELLLKVVFQAK